MDSPKGKIRKLVSALGPLLTWRVKVLRHAPLHSYKMQNGEWTDVIEIETFAHTLLELSNVDRQKFTNEIVYCDNIIYSDYS